MFFEIVLNLFRRANLRTCDPPFWVFNHLVLHIWSGKQREIPPDAVNIFSGSQWKIAIYRTTIAWFMLRCFQWKSNFIGNCLELKTEDNPNPHPQHPKKKNNNNKVTHMGFANKIFNIRSQIYNKYSKNSEVVKSCNHAKLTMVVLLLPCSQSASK